MKNKLPVLVHFCNSEGVYNLGEGGVKVTDSDAHQAVHVFTAVSELSCN